MTTQEELDEFEKKLTIWANKRYQEIAEDILTKAILNKMKEDDKIFARSLESLKKECK